MNKFSMECERIIEEMRTRFTAFDEAKKMFHPPRRRFDLKRLKKD
jgi:hypothetical protein